MATMLEPDILLALCKKLDGYDGAIKYLADQGLKNPKTSKPFTKHAIIYTVRKAKGFEEWRKSREKERTDTTKEFKRIAMKRLAHQAEKKAK